MLKKIVIVSIIAGVSFTCNAQNKKEKEQIIAHIQERDSQFESFFEIGNADSIASLFSPNCHFAIPKNKLIESREKVREFLSDEFENGKKYSVYELKPEEHKVYNNIVLEIGTCVQEYSNLTEKQLSTSKMNYMFVWKKTKSGKFKIRSAFWTQLK